MTTKVTNSFLAKLISIAGFDVLQKMFDNHKKKNTQKTAFTSVMNSIKPELLISFLICKPSKTPAVCFLMLILGRKFAKTFEKTTMDLQYLNKLFH